MPAKIRLQRRGKKGQPFYHIMIADGRAPRDGRFIEKIGYYNPLTKPAEIEINFESALYWLQKGAQPTDTVRAILSYKGVMYKNHLLKGVQKGALTPEQVEEKFQVWLSEKEARINSKKNEQELSLKEAHKAALDHEKKVNETKAQALAKKYAKAKKAAEGEAEEEGPAAKEGATEVTGSVAEPAAGEVTEEGAKAEEPAPEEEPTQEEPTEEEPTGEEPTVEEPTVEEPTVEEPKKEEPLP
ncbi:MAG: 30S ribosomal protein S16 [Bacteroidota bacterium]